MTILRLTKPVIMVLFAILLLSACGPSEDERVATSVAATQTSLAGVIEPATDEPPDPTEDPGDVFAGDLKPLDSAECDGLGAAMNQVLAVQIEQINVAVEREGKTGGGCQMIAVGSGLDFVDMMSVEDDMRKVLAEHGWLEDSTASVCLSAGGSGPGANTWCYTQADAFCELFIQTDPIDPTLCSDDEPIFLCFERLDPEQIIYTTNLTCSRDSTAVTEPLESELMRIEFGPGEIQATVQGEVAAGGFDHYVIAAMADQEMTVNLLDLTGEVIAYNTAVLVIWGADGTVLISSHADALGWAGPLPFSQDYYVDVKSISEQPVPYTLEIIIPPLSYSSSVFPEVEPFSFGEMQSIVLTGVPPMLPPEFPVEEGLPSVFPYTLTMVEGEYELSLDYGADCQGAGACHYGGVGGMKVDSEVPLGTSSVPFVLEDAQVVDLSHGITGYFVPAVCNASCGDARMWWIYEGYQYMLGLKADVYEDVLALANAAIENSVP